MNIVSKIMMTSFIAFGVFVANAEIDGSGFFGADCDGTIRASFIERGLSSDNNEISYGIEDVKMSISLVGSPDLGVSMLSSDESGNIEFTNVCPGLYKVEVGAESVPSNLEFGGVIETLSGVEIWGSLDRLLPLELHVAGVRNADTSVVNFALEYSFMRNTCDDFASPECLNSRPSFAYEAGDKSRK